MTITIGLSQINNSFSGANYLPYSIGMLQAFVEGRAADPRRFRFLPPVYKRQPIRDIVAQLAGADVAGFSLYVWNAHISLEAARRLKAARPEMLIVFGGPHVPDQPEAFLRAHPFIDVAVHNEGERTFLDILEGLPGRDWQAIPGVSFIAADGRYLRTPPRPRMRDLHEAPSPFLTGVFDRLMADHPDETWIGLWETNRGCPFQCTFCDWGSATAAKVTQFDPERLLREVDWFAARRIEFVFCCDANFGILKRDVEIAEYMAATKARVGFPKAFSVQNTKNATERAYLTQKILSDSGLNKGVTLALQSIDPGTLAAIKRDNISLDTYMELQRRFTRDGVETYTDVILGLPGETYDSYVNGVSRIIENGQHNRIQFNNLTILPNAEMGDPAYRAKYGMVTVETEIINLHGQRVVSDDDVVETQHMVVATHAMPEEDWRRVRAFSWMTAFLHFDKLFQVPLICAHELTGIAYRDLVEAFMAADPARFPLIAGIAGFFMKEARGIQQGGFEYVFAERWLGIFWPADEYVFIDLTERRALPDFYREAEALLTETLAGRGPVPAAVIRDAVAVNAALVKTPFADGDIEVACSHDVLAFHRSVVKGLGEPLRAGPVRYRIARSGESWASFADWCREVVWYGNKKGAYLYGNQAVHVELAGHH